MKRIFSKNLLALFFAAITIFAVCLPVSAAVERQNVHINTPGISLEIPGDAIYNIKEADTGELMSASDPGNTYKLTLEAEKSGDIFTYKDLSKSEIDQTQKDIQAELNAEKVTTYETSQAVFFDCISNTDKYLLTTTIVNGYKYQLKLSVERRELTISDHGIFNTAARSIVFDSIEQKPAEVNVLGTIVTVVCIVIGVVVVVALAFIVARSIRKKLPNKEKTDKNKISLSGKAHKAHKSQKPQVRTAAMAEVKAESEKPKMNFVNPVVEEKPMRAVKAEKSQPIKPKKRDTRADSAAESFYNEIAGDGLFDEQAAEDIPTQVQLDFIENQPGDEKFENNPVRMRVDIIKPTYEGDDAEDSDLYELSRSNNEDYDEAVSDDEYAQDDGFGRRVKGIFGKNQRDNSESSSAKPEREKDENVKQSGKPARRDRPQRTEEERQQAAQRRAQRQANRSEHKSTYSDSEFVKSFDNDSYWDKYR
ncbi:hypothetical protein [Ruminococcus sp. zg-921]|nr:hypothetical protein [Ruminococcus sp. zg-921]